MRFMQLGRPSSGRIVLPAIVVRAVSASGFRAAEQATASASGVRFGQVDNNEPREKQSNDG